MLLKAFDRTGVVSRWCIMKFYAVRAGRKPGVYKTWNDCSAQVKSFSGAIYKKFSTLDEAEHFVKKGTDFETENKLLCDLFEDELHENSKSKNHDNFGLASEKSSINGDLLGKRKHDHSDHGDASEQKSFKMRCNDTSSYLPGVDSRTTVTSKIKRNDSASEHCPVVFTDGACTKNGRTGSKAGYGVWWGKNHPLNLSCKLDGIQTNQRAEIAAINAAIRQAKSSGYKDLLIKTDSMFVINCMTKWVHGWKSRNWTKADGKPVVHKVEFLEMLKNMSHVKVKFEHVRGHKGIHGNEMADQLAVAGTQL